MDFLTLPNDFSMSIIPGYDYSEDMAHMAFKYGFETLLHMDTYTFKKLFNHALNMITGFSVLPLQIASMMGFFLSLFVTLALF